MKIILPVPKLPPLKLPGLRLLNTSVCIKAHYASVRSLAVHLYVFAAPIVALLLVGGLLFWNQGAALLGWYVLAATMTCAACLELHLMCLDLLREWIENG